MKKLLILMLFPALALASCNKETETGMPRLTFRLTDAPADYDRVNIDIVGAEAIIDGEKIDLEVNTGVYNLLDFANGKDTILVDQHIPSGQLSQIRLILGDNNNLELKGQSFDLTTPSAQQSGLKLNVHAELVDGIAYEYIIDFDAARSIVHTGNGKHILKPVIRVFTKSVSGAIEGVVSPAKAKPLVYAISAQLDSVSAFADTTSGKFMFRGLSSGSYKLRFLPVSPYKDSTLYNVAVTNGIVTKLDTLKF
ncbi:MAG: DUF4382 domain-containing protein [Bacteroidales bacterium]